MLNAPTPFPQVGSYALIYDSGETKLVRIQHRLMGPDGPAALISFPGSFGASGNRTVPIGQLLDPTPLSDEERAEYLRLFGRLSAVKRPKREDVARHDALRLRDIRADVLAEKLRLAGLAKVAA